MKLGWTAWRLKWLVNNLIYNDMSNDNNVILNLPFDEADGANVAYDYSVSRADALVTGCGFVAGKQGNCIEFGGSGFASVGRNLLPLSGDFTLLAWLRRKGSSDDFTGRRLGFWFAWDAVNGFREAWVNLSEDWNYTQKEMDCEFASLKFSVSNVSNSDLYLAIFLKNLLIASLKSSFVR